MGVKSVRSTRWPTLKGGALGVADQVGGGGDPNQDKGQATELRVLGAGGVEVAESDKEVVGEVEAQGGVDFIDENHQRGLQFRQHDRAKEAGHALGEPEMRMGLPPVQQVRIQVKLIFQFRQQSQIPFFRRHLRPNRLQVNNGGANPFLLQLLRRLYHQAGLAHLARGQHIGKGATPTEFQQLIVRSPGDVEAVACLDGAADGVEGGVGGGHGGGGVGGGEG